LCLTLQLRRLLSQWLRHRSPLGLWLLLSLRLRLRLLLRLRQWLAWLQLLSLPMELGTSLRL